MTFVNFLSWSATLSTFLFFSTGTITCRDIVLKSSTENVPYLPFLVSAFCCFMWTTYGIAKKDSTIVFINAIGVTLQCIYLICHFIYSKTEPVFKHTVYIVLLTCSILAYFNLYITDEQESIKKMGLACCVITVLMFASPLASVAKIYQTQSTETLSFPLSLMTVVNSSLWCAYGYVVRDIFVVVPNALGLLLGFIQVSLFCIFPENSRPVVVSL